MFREVIDPTALRPLMLDHYRWIIALEKEGLVFGSGPLFKADGSQGVGMTIFRAPDQVAAAAMAALDPFVSGGAASFTIERWQVNEGRITMSIDFSDQSFSFA